MDKKKDISDSDGVTLRSLSNKLNVGVPFSKSYVFNGQKGTFIIKYDRQRPIDKIVDSDE